MGDLYAYPMVSVIVPCRNEKDYLTRCVESILNNGYPGTLEVIIVDGMSNDGSRDILRGLMLEHETVRVLHNPWKTTPVAMNLGLEEARGEIVFRVDAHCQLRPGYLLTATRHLLVHKNIGCVGGCTIARSEGTPIQEAIVAVLGSPVGVGNSYFRISSSKVREVDTVAFGAYRREVLEKIGGFDERLVRNQDIELNYRLRKAGYRILLDPSIQVYYSPRRSVKAFCKQNFDNGFWNIITWRLVPGSLSWRHFVPLLFVSWLIVFGILGIFTPVPRALFYWAIGAYVTLDALESTRIAIKERKPSLLATFLIFPVLHVSYGVGSLCGIFSVLFRRTTGVSRCTEPKP